MKEPIAILQFQCKRCGWKWIPRKPEMPVTCPNQKCRSPIWNMPREIKEEKK